MAAVTLDWRRHKTGPLRVCRICKTNAICRDENGKPCHKTCAEAEIAVAAQNYAKEAA